MTQVQIMMNDIPKFSQHSKFDKEFNLIEIIEKNNIGEIIKIEKFDSFGNLIYHESLGVWYKQEIDNYGNIVYFENSDGEWFKKEYNEFNLETYHENDCNYWCKSFYHPPVELENGVLHHWHFLTIFSDGVEIHSDFYGRIVCMKYSGGSQYITDYDDENGTITQTYSNGVNITNETIKYDSTYPSLLLKKAYEEYLKEAK